MVLPGDDFSAFDAKTLTGALDLLPAAVSVWDRQMRNVYANAVHESWFGVSVAGLQGRRVDEMIGADAMQIRRPAFEAALDGREQRFEGSVSTPSGRRRLQVRLSPYRPDGKGVAGVVALGVDITEAHETRQRLVDQGRQLRLLYERTPALLLSIDRTGRVLSVTDRCLAALGRTRAEVVERPLVDLFADESRRRALALGLPALFRDGHLDRWAFEIRCPDGRALSVLLSAIVEPDAGRALATLDDVTAEVRGASELRRLHEQRQQLERHAQALDELLRERERIVDVLAHEVRQPLNNASAALQSAAALLAAKGEAAASERLERAQAVLGEVLAGVDNTLAASTLLAGAGEPALADADIDTVIAVTVADLPPAARTRVRVERLSATRTAVLDVGLVRLTLRNLLANALAWSPPGAPVIVRVSDSEDPLALVIDVVDQGPGIADAVRPRLFERGARAGERDSHGLGLFIARRAMELQGGRVDVLASGPGGTTMRLLIAA